MAQPITRVVVDECVGMASKLMRLFRQSLTPTTQLEIVRLAERHRGIPDVEVLRRVLGPDAILLTEDRILHNQACDLGLRSCTLDAKGELRREKLPGIPAPKPVVIPGHCELSSDYVHPSNPVATALKQGMSERDFERYRKRRRRIRSYFGAEGNIASAAMTIGAAATPKGLLCGFVLRLAAKSGVKGLHASEGYGVSPMAEAKSAWCLIHALRELYLLQLENIPAQLYILPTASLELCQELIQRGTTANAPAEDEALYRLLKGLAGVELFPCAKGPFFDRMEKKLAQLARSRTNEFVAVNFRQIIAAFHSGEKMEI